jgi:hypothetical protein
LVVLQFIGRRRGQKGSGSPVTGKGDVPVHTVDPGIEEPVHRTGKIVDFPGQGGRNRKFGG